MIFLKKDLYVEHWAPKGLIMGCFYSNGIDTELFKASASEVYTCCYA